MELKVCRQSRDQISAYTVTAGCADKISRSRYGRTVLALATDRWLYQWCSTSSSSSGMAGRLWGLDHTSSSFLCSDRKPGLSGLWRPAFSAHSHCTARAPRAQTWSVWKHEGGRRGQCVCGDA